MAFSARQRAAVNAIGIAASQGVVLVVGFLLVPFMLRRLGQDDYGLYQLVRSFLGYLPLLTLAVGPAVSRYATYAVGQGDRDGVNRYMSTGLAVMCGIAAILMLGGGGFAWLLPRLFDLGDASQVRDAQWLLVFLAATSAVVYVRIIYNTPQYAHEQLAEQSAVNASADILRAVGIVAAFLLFAPSLWWIGLSALAGTVVSALLAVWTAYRLWPWLGVSMRLIDRRSVRELVSFSFFTTLSVLAIALFYSTDNLLIQWMYGKETGLRMITVYSVAANWDPWIRNAIQPLTRIITPRMTLLAAQNRREDMQRLTVLAVRYSTAVVSPICIGASAFALPILRLWLGDRLGSEDLETAARIMPILLLPVILWLGVIPAYAVFVAEAKIGEPTLVRLAVGAVKVGLSYVLAWHAGWGLLGVAAGTGIGVAVYSALYMPDYLRRVLGLSVGRLWIGGLLRPLLLSVGFWFVCDAARRLILPKTIVELALACAACGVVYVAACWAVVVLPEDRERAVRTVGRLVGRRGG